MNSEKFSSSYNHLVFENDLQNDWFNSDVYYWNEVENKEESFVIDTPPPGVSGVLHMGHVFSYCHTDFIARYQRMKGKNVFYPIGFDDNGQPSEKLIEKVIGKRFSEMKKEGRVGEFLEKCDEFLPEAEKDFEKLFKALGFSYDWRQVYRTISKECTQIAQLSFKDLLDKDLIYQKMGPVYWDTIDQTALAQADIIDIEKEGVECRFYFQTEDGEKLEVMSTRPEMLPACVALFYHPEDERWFHIKGKNAIVPLTGERVKILPDIDVKKDKGSGLVMCCTYGDIQDKTWVNRHSLQSKQIISRDGKISDIYVKDARKLAIEVLEKEGLLIETKTTKHMVKCGEYSKAPIEIIESHQWYLKTLEFKEDLLEIVQHINFHPSHMKNRLIQWIEGLNQDWCISRDRGFGVKIENNEQVFDTWFTSSVSPQLNSLGINDEHFVDIERHSKLYPSNLRPQAHEIIRTWAFYTVLKAYLHGLTKDDLQSREKFLQENLKSPPCENEKTSYNKEKRELIKKWFELRSYDENRIKAKLIPWKDVMLSGWCLAKDGTKMSKSKGNVVTPLDLIQEKGVDVIRYWAGSCSLGVDTAYNETKFADGKKLVNKLWNASKFCHSHFEKLNGCFDVSNITKTVDKIVIARLCEVVIEFEKHMSVYEYSKAKDAIEDFFWKVFCDNYLEIVKKRAYNECHSALNALHFLNKAILKLFAPFMPYVTDAIWKEVGFESGSIHKRGNFVKNEEFAFISLQKTDKNVINDLFEVIADVRKMKTENKMAMNSAISKIVITQTFAADVIEDLKAVLNATEIEIGNEFRVVV
jgi:valyl-tRNA synthetase